MMIRNIILLLACAVCGCITTSKTPTAAAAMDQWLPYLAVDSMERSIYPEALASGELYVANGCVVFDAAGSLRTPIFPRGSQLRSNATGELELIVGGKPLRIGERYVFSGGDVSLTSPIALAEPAPAACPPVYWIVGSVSKD